MEIFFSSDLHINHFNIIEYSNRPFKDVYEMNETIISNWNKVVKPNDIVYFLGDFIFSRDINEIERYIKMLNGKINIIFGNHDKVVKRANGFYSKNVVLEEYIDNQLVVMYHYAMRVWNKSHFGSYMLHGHSHGTLPELDNLLSFDVGVDANNFTPVSYERVKNRMSKKNFIPVKRNNKE
ncbi:MAG: metallophosphoesterase family protein [Nanoarchaeota archaeon]